MKAGWLVAVATAMVATSSSGAMPVPEPVTFESKARDAATGRQVQLRAQLFRPAEAAAGSAPRPAVIALHGCGGMYADGKTRSDRLSARHAATASQLVADGYVVLFPDSMRPRGVEEVCTLAAGKRPVTVNDRRLDVIGALDYLQTRPDVAADRIAVLGWSHGGATVLAAMNKRDLAVAARRGGGAPYLRAGAAFYPGCAASVGARTGYALAAPLAMYVGGADDWTPPEPCVRLADALAGAGEPVSITVYPGAYHGFDGSAGKRIRRDVPGGVHAGQGVTIAGDPQARDDSHARLRAFLRQHLGGSNAAGPAAADATAGDAAPSRFPTPAN